MPLGAGDPALMYCRLSDSAGTGTGLYAPLELGASRLGFHDPSIVVELAGADVSHNVLRESVRISERRDAKSASFITVGITPAVNEDVKIGAGSLSARIFRGTVVDVSLSRFKATEGRVAYRVSCQSWGWTLDAALVTKRYTAQSATAIAEDLIDTYSTGFTKNVESGLATIDEIAFTMVPLYQALRRLANRLGAYVEADYEKVIHFGTTVGAWPNPESLTLSNTKFREFRHGNAGRRLVNRILVEGYGTQVSRDVSVGATTFPVEDGSVFEAGGGTIKAERSQTLTYTSRGVSGDGSTVSNSLAAPGAPAVATGGAGVIEGDYRYACAFKDATGMTAVGALSAVVSPAKTYALPKLWDPQSMPVALECEDVCYSSTRNEWVAVGLGAGATSTTKSAVSSDGKSWTEVSTLPSAEWRSVVWCTGISLYVAVASVGATRVATSPDGRTWTGRTQASAEQWQKVEWSESLGRVVAVALGTPTTSLSMWSDNGTTWTSGTGVPSKSWQDVRFANSLWVAVSATGGTGDVMTSTDGKAWTARTSVSGGFTAIEYAPALLKWVALGSAFSGRSVETSTDAITWAETTNALPEGVFWDDLVWSPEAAVFMAVATSGNGRAATSANGTTWTPETTATQSTWAAVAWSAKQLRFVAVAGDDGVAQTQSFAAAGTAVALSTIPTSTGKHRVLFRTKRGGTALFELTTIQDDSTTTFTDDSATDADLGPAAPTVSTISVLAGDTTIRVQDLSKFLAGGGWALAASQYLRYTGRSGSSGEGTLTGVPATGAGAVVANIRGQTEILPSGFVAGVPASGAGSVQTALLKGDPVHILIQRDDAASQATYGIRERFIQDRRLNKVGCENRGDAELALSDLPRVEASCLTSDTNAKVNREQTIGIYGFSEVRRINSVEVSVEHDRPYPVRRVTMADNDESDLQAELRLIREQAQT